MKSKVWQIKSEPKDAQRPKSTYFVTKDTSSLHHKAILLYQAIIQFHLNDTNSNALQVLTHEESILALRPKYASPNNVVSENYLYSSNGSISYSYTYNAGLPSIANASATSSMYTGTVKFYY